MPFWHKRSDHIPQMRSILGKPAGIFRSAIVRSSCGARESPSPAIIVVTPWRSLLSAVTGSSSRGSVEPPIMSMKPGARTLPFAWMVRFAARWERSPISTMMPLRTPTSARWGFPEPSTTCAPVIRMSNASDWAKLNGAKSRKKEQRQIYLLPHWLGSITRSWRDTIRERVAVTKNRRERSNGMIVPTVGG